MFPFLNSIHTDALRSTAGKGRNPDWALQTHIQDQATSYGHVYTLIWEQNGQEEAAINKFYGQLLASVNPVSLEIILSILEEHHFDRHLLDVFRDVIQSNKMYAGLKTESPARLLAKKARDAKFDAVWDARMQAKEQKRLLLDSGSNVPNNPSTVNEPPAGATVQLVHEALLARKAREAAYHGFANLHTGSSAVSNLQGDILLSNVNAEDSGDELVAGGDSEYDDLPDLIDN